MIKGDLEIFLITYNRIERLKYTLKRILEGPIKGFDIKILDNASDDGTKDFCEELQNSYKNFTYIRNKINLGISGNIIRAMELASKKWLWILCDDDDFNWDNWNEIEQALDSNDYDIVHTTYTEGFRSEEYSYLINEEAFIPTCIYNTKHITPLTMQNAYALAYTLLPHHAIGCKVINEKGKIFVPQKRCVLQGTNDKLNFIRMPRNGLFHKIDDYQLLAGYIGAYRLIEDEEIRQKCNSVLCLGQSFRNSMYWFLDNNPRNNLHNIFEILINVNDSMKRDLISVLCERNIVQYFEFLDKLSLYANGSSCSYQVLKDINKKIDLIVNRPTFLQQIFSVRNEGNHKVLRILGLKIKFRRRT